VPEDCSLVGIDNLQSHIPVPFPLTSVDIPKEQMANLIVNSLYRLMQEGFACTAKQILTPELIVRDSTRPLK
jgi:DNA-binding LacI/PurR family transcriptional regulator